MEEVTISLRNTMDDSYDIIIGRNLFPLIADGLSKLNLDKIGIITDSNVKKLYASDFHSLLRDKKIFSILITFQAGELHKTRYTKEKIEDTLISNGFTRNSALISLGGGVVGDVTGFVASTYLRGVPYLQIPTTLLAMVDSSIGGKTGVNTPQGKNLIGTFYQPKRVFIDIDVLKTLPKEELLNGISEMLKHAIIKDQKFFIFMQDYSQRLISLDEYALTEGIAWSCRIKKEFVEKDEKDESERKLLNFGHTIGHALEAASSYKISHGHAIALGMFAETKISHELKLINSLEMQKITGLIEKFGFSSRLPDINIKKITDFIFYDKKKIRNIIPYVLPKKVGEVIISSEVSQELVTKVLGEIK